jgi:mannose-6-phosphate isomerase-like protein (cupin superfamily)
MPDPKEGGIVEPRGSNSGLNGVDVDRVKIAGGEEAIRFPWGSIQWLCAGQLYADAQQTFGHVQIDPGQKNPLHYHPNSDEVLFLIEGELLHSLGGRIYHLKPGMSIHIPQGVEHDARNPTDRVARMVVSYPTADRQVVMVEAGEE